MRIDTCCEQCGEWVPVQTTPLDYCLDCGGFICPACRPSHSAHRVDGDTYLTCQPHTPEDVAALVEAPL